MLFSADTWPRIADGTVTVTFRTWTRPQARTGGRYRVGGMLIEADDVRTVTVADITDDDVARSGHVDRAALLARLGGAAPGSTVWRVELLRRHRRPHRAARRRELPAAELAEVIARLDRFDRRADGPPWTRATLRLIVTIPAW